MKTIQFCLISFVLTFAAFGQTPNLTKYVDSYANKHNFNGTILIQKNSKIAYQKSFGYANIPYKIPNKLDTKFKVASITKAFTSVLIMQLVEQGKIDLNKTIKTYLTNYTGEAADKVTIHQLLNHTSGMVNMDRNITSAESAIKNGFPQYQLPHSTDEMLAKYCSEKLVNEPGKAFDYNNADYIILGKIIEQIYGKNFEQVLKEKIREPLKMRDSGMLYQHNIVPNLADTYFYRDDLKKLANDLPVYIENWYASGAMYSTANDLLKFSNALFGMKLLKKETLDKMFTSGLGEYGYGVWVYEDYEINKKMFKIIKRPGTIMGANSMLFHLLNEGTTIIILSNTGPTELDEFVAEIAKKVVH